MNRWSAALPVLVFAALALPAGGDSNISATDRHAWSEITGWLNWRDAEMGQAGAHVGCLVLRGFVWGENIGWINLGDGSPANGVAYANVDGSDFGVNVSAAGELSGLAWSENGGWINFSGGAMASPPQPARVDFGERRLYGYAWGENIGWINLDDQMRFVALLPACAGDADGDGMVTFDDITTVLANWNIGYTPAGCDGPGDANLDGAVNFDDITAVLANWNGMCP